MTHAQTHDSVTGLFGNILPLKYHAAALGRQQAGDRMQRCGLARAVGADQCHNLSLVDLKGNVMQRVNQAVIDIQIAYFQHCHNTVPSFSRPDMP